MHTRLTHRQAFTLVELLALIALVIVIIGILLPLMGQARGGGTGGTNVFSQSNLRMLNNGAANYSADHNNQLFSFTWEAGQEYYGEFNAILKPQDTKSATANEAYMILLRATGRNAGKGKISQTYPQLLHLRYSHLILLDYLTDRQPEPIAASPFDRNLNNWQQNPLAYLDQDNPFPYGNGFPAKPGYDTDPTWTDPAVMQLWPFASSYQVVPHAWLNDTDPQYTPSPNSPHHMIRQADEDAPLGGRKLTEVAFPAQKVFMYEEFDHQSGRSPLYASDPNARINLAFFDGSVRSQLVKDANSAQDTDNPNRIWQQPYLPLDTFPVPRGGLRDSTPLDLRFRWTKDGLAGTDY